MLNGKDGKVKGMYIEGGMPISRSGPGRGVERDGKGRNTARSEIATPAVDLEGKESVDRAAIDQW